jgi:hypothetical protein
VSASARTCVCVRVCFCVCVCVCVKKRRWGRWHVEGPGREGAKREASRQRGGKNKERRWREEEGATRLAANAKARGRDARPLGLRRVASQEQGLGRARPARCTQGTVTPGRRRAARRTSSLPVPPTGGAAPAVPRAKPAITLHEERASTLSTPIKSHACRATLAGGGERAPALTWTQMRD